MRQILLPSVMRSSWQCEPIEGMGLECGMASETPRCSSRNR